MTSIVQLIDHPSINFNFIVLLFPIDFFFILFAVNSTSYDDRFTVKDVSMYASSSQNLWNHEIAIINCYSHSTDTTNNVDLNPITLGIDMVGSVLINLEQLLTFTGCPENITRDPKRIWRTNSPSEDHIVGLVYAESDHFLSIFIYYCRN